MTDPIVTCKAGAVVAAGAVAVECVQTFMGIPREVLYAALTGACIGIARRDKGDEWRELLANGTGKMRYLLVVAKAVVLGVTVFGNALVCAWVADLLRFAPITAEVAKAAPVALAGVLSYGSWTMLPAAFEAAKVWLNRKAGGQ